MGCKKCNDCKDPFVLPTGAAGKDGTNGENGADGTNGTNGTNGEVGSNGLDGRGYNATSTTSLDNLTTLSTTASATISTEKAYTSGARVRFTDVAQPSFNFFEGICTSYDPVTGVMTIGSIDLLRGTGTVASWDVNVAGEHGFNIYDSGWKTINSYKTVNGESFGLAPTAGWTNPKVRVAGRTVFVNGVFLIPLAQNGASTVLRTPWLDAQSTYKTDTETYTGTDGGFTTNSNGSIESKSSILPTALRSDLDFITFDRHLYGARGILDTGGTDVILCETVFNSCYFRSSGKLLLTSHKDIDDSVGTPINNAPAHLKITVADAGANVPSYSSYKQQIGGFTITDSGKTYPTNIDGEDETMWGAYYFNMNFSYPLASTVTEQQARTAFDSI